MIKGNNVAALWVCSRDIAPLEAIALGASKGKVFWPSRSTVLSRDDVVDLMHESGVGSMYQAVLATLQGAGRNKEAQASGNLGHRCGYCSSRVEALALRRESMRSMAM